MSKHLPECCALMCECDETHFRSIDCDFSCICPSLRACEERVRMEDDDYAYVAAQAEADGRRQGWAAALNAVREAVVRLPAHGRVAYALAVSKPKVIEAIEALRTNTSP